MRESTSPFSKATHTPCSNLDKHMSVEVSWARSIQSSIKIYRDILKSHSRPSGRRRREVRSWHDGLRGWEADDGTFLEAVFWEVYDWLRDRRVVSALRGRSRLPFLPTAFPTNLGRSLLGGTGVRGRRAGFDGVLGVSYAEG